MSLSCYYLYLSKFAAHPFGTAEAPFQHMLSGPNWSMGMIEQ